MKRKTLIHASVAVSAMAFMVAGVLLGVNQHNKNVEKTEASSYTVNSVPKTIDCNDTSAANIRSYYANLNNLSTSERQGTNLLKNLKPILKNGQKYYSYGSSATTAVWQVYEIVDRDWKKSPASAISGYNTSTKIISNYTYGTSNSSTGSNPYLHALYVNRNVTNQTQAWGNHNQDQWGINQEHVWPKAEGFDDTSKGCGARGDIMHLWAGNGKVNGTYHSNYYYGYVDKSRTYNDASSYASTLSGNLKGYSKTFGGSTTVFEPQDSDKGDIARAIFYMAARYNYYSGSDSDGIDAGNPNLVLTQSLSDWASTGYTSTTTNTGKMGILQDLLEWNRLDPPDEWEIHRNNLCYNNFTNNRNPFIDFPEWAEYIWGKSTSGSYSSNPTGYAIPSADKINEFGNAVTTPTITLNRDSITLPINGTVTLNATAQGGSGNVTWSTSNSSRAQLSATTGNTVTVTGKASGSATITASYSGKTATCSITVSATAPTVSSVTVSPATLSLDLNGTKTGNLSATVSGTNNPAQTVTWSTSNQNVATVSSSGVVTAVAKGTATITATSTVDPSKSGSCAITVVKSSSSGSGHWETSTTAYRKVLFGSSYNQSSVNNYTSTWVSKNSENATSTDFSVSISNFNNNNNGWAYIKTGRKNNDCTGTITTVEAMDQPIGKVSINLSGLTVANCSSITLYYDDDVNFGSPESLSFTKSTGVQTVEIEEPESDLYYKLEFVCTSASSNGVVVLNEVDFYNSTFIPDGTAAITSVTVEPESLILDLNGQNSETLNAMVEGEDEPDTTVTWSSSNPSVASVTNAGVVTAVSTGNAIITATSTVDVTKSGSCEVTVIDSGASVTGVSFTQGSPYINGIAYKMYFENAQDGNTYYFNGNKNGNYGATATAIHNAADVYFEANGTTGQNIYFMKDNVKNYFCVVEATSSGKTYYNFGYSTDTPTTPWYYLESGEDYACMTYTYNNTLYTFGTYAAYTTIGTIDLSKYTDEYEIEFVTEDPKAPTAFSQLFLNNIVCDASGTSAPTFATGITWNQFSKAYAKMTPSLQSVLINADGNENGTTIEKFAARYDYIVGKYGVESYSNFLGRSVVSYSNIQVFKLIGDNAKLILIVMALLGTFTFAGWFIHKKKQYDL